MKKFGLLSFMALIPVILSSCSFAIPEEKVVEKTKLKYCYEDYFANNVYTSSSCPTYGDVNLLVIPIWFTDSYMYIDNGANKANVLADINTSFNGSTEDTGWHSVSSFFKEESNSILKLNGVVSEWYECGKSVSSFYRSYSNTANLVLDSVDWYFATHDKTRSDFDSDGDGYLDGVVLIYGAPDYAALEMQNNSNLWAYTSWVMDEEEKDVENPGTNVFLWASYDFMYSESDASRRSGSSYGTGDTSYCTIDAHTYIHEMGHVLGLEDYYDYSDERYTPAGAFSMQDYNMGGHDPYSVMAYGWADPIIPTESVTVTIKDFQSSHDVILLANHTVDSPFDEYMLLELFTPTGLNEFDCAHQYGHYFKGPSYPGIRLWHVDARLLYIKNPNRISQNDLTTDPLTDKGYVMHAFSNTYDKDATVLGQINKDYADYNILQLIRDKIKTTYRPTDTLTNGVLFQEGSSYRQSLYSSQFVKSEKMNDGNELGWRFTVNKLSKDSATISLYKTK